MDDLELESLMAKRRGIAPQPLSVGDIEGLILNYAQDLQSNPKVFETIEGGIAELTARNKRFAELPADEKRRLYVEALQDLATKETRASGGQPTSKFARLILTALGVASKVVDVARDPTKIVNVAQEFLTPAFQQLTGQNHPNNPRAVQGSGSALVGGGNDEVIEKIVGKVDELIGRVSKLEGSSAPQGVPVPN
jgi:hypothetical protein